MQAKFDDTIAVDCHGLKRNKAQIPSPDQCFSLVVDPKPSLHVTLRLISIATLASYIQCFRIFSNYVSI